MVVEVRNAVFGYGDQPVVRVEALRLESGRCLGVYGPNGSGKTTLLRGLTGLLRPLEGSVTYEGGPRFGYLPQHRSLAAESHWPMTALDAAALATSARRRLGWVGRSDRQRLRQEMAGLGVGELARRAFALLSGGQQQRVLLAGAMAADPQVLVLDEPTEGLDLRSRAVLLDRLKAATAAGLCAVLVSHDPADLLAVAGVVALLEPAEEIGRPSHTEVMEPSRLPQRLTTHEPA
jgi:ABC-type Mn2+/Zn2+ transport system ATPase subunit